MDETTRRIHAAVRRIPRGKVAGYGQVAALAGLPRRARLVGRVLSALPAGSSVPWYRVVNASGGVSLPSVAGDEQRRRLAAEGVALTPSGRVPMALYAVGRSGEAPEAGPPPGKKRVSPRAGRR